MTEDEAVLCVGRVIDIWSDASIPFDEWEAAFTPRTAELGNRAIDHFRASSPRTRPQLGEILSWLVSPPPAPQPRNTVTPPAPPTTPPTETQRARDREAFLRGYAQGSAKAAARKPAPNTEPADIDTESIAS